MASEVPRYALGATASTTTPAVYAPGVAFVAALKPHTTSAEPVPAAAIWAIFTGAVGTGYQLSASLAVQVPLASLAQEATVALPPRFCRHAPNIVEPPDQPPAE